MKLDRWEQSLGGRAGLGCLAELGRWGRSSGAWAEHEAVLRYLRSGLEWGSTALEACRPRRALMLPERSEA